MQTGMAIDASRIGELLYNTLTGIRTPVTVGVFDSSTTPYGYRLSPSARYFPTVEAHIPCVKLSKVEKLGDPRIEDRERVCVIFFGG